MVRSRCEIVQPLWQVFQYRHYPRMLSLFYYNNYVTIYSCIPKMEMETEMKGPE